MTTGIHVYESVGKHFRRMSTLDKLDFVIALWTNRSALNLTKGQESFVDKVAMNAQGYASQEECDEDRKEILKADFGGRP
jgi:hypothetical protein